MSEQPEPSTAAEFSRMADRRGITGLPVQLTATPAECAALAKRFAVRTIDTLTAEIMLDATGAEIAASGTLTASIVQVCAISGDDLPTTIREEFSLRFVPESEWADLEAEEIELSEDELDAIPFDGTSFDLGEAVAQSLALAIDPYAVGPDAERARQEAGIIDESAPSGPLAEALAALKKG